MWLLGSVWAGLDLHAGPLRPGLMSAGLLQATDLVEKLKKASVDKKNAGAKEGAMLAINALAVTVGKPVEPYLVPLLPNILALYADKVRNSLERGTITLPFVRRSMQYMKDGCYSIHQAASARAVSHISEAPSGCVRKVEPRSIR
jgi:hypothetical protein